SPPTPRAARARPSTLHQWGHFAYDTSFPPRVCPSELDGLLFTIIIRFALQGHQITKRPSTQRTSPCPLPTYLTIMCSGGYLLGTHIVVVPLVHPVGDRVRW
ncbi:MAG: hypothetical protein WCG47_30355, partial [Dermatophilaceae bacterium]